MQEMKKINRRYVLYSLAAVAAGLAGFGVARWRQGQGRHSLWGLSFETPHGQSLSMAQFLGKPLLINFWATWCPPCVEELPLLNDFYLKNKARGWEVVGLAVDQASAVQRYLRQVPLNFPVAVVGAGGIELTRSWGNLSGALPFSLVFGADGTLLHRHLGRVSAADLSAWAGLR